MKPSGPTGAGSGASAQVLVFRRRKQANTFGVYLGLLALFSAVGLAVAHGVQTRIGYGLLTIAFAVAAVRAFRSATVVQSGERVTVRTVQRTHTFARRDVRRFSAQRSSVFGRSRSLLGIELASGRVQTFPTFSGPVDEAADSSVAGVAARLNRNWQLRQS